MGRPKRMDEVLGRILLGDSEKEIGRVLGISTNTVHGYVTALYRKHGVHSRGELMSLFVKTRSASVRPKADGVHNS
jgi:DNA-binding CsgD family transcriptional regulator